MKTHVLRWKKVIKDIIDAIETAEENGLPLCSIQLDSTEWDAFVIARTTLANGKRIEGGVLAFESGTAMYRNIEIYKEGASR